MAETDPVIVRIEADTNDLKAGLKEGETALQSFDKTSQSVGKTIRGFTGDSRTLFRSLVEMRIALMGVEHTMKLFGIQNAGVSAIMNNLNAIMDVAITLSGIYRAVKVAEGVAAWFVTYAHLAEATAKVAAATLFIGVPVAIATALAIVATMKAQTPPGAQRGGIILPRSGGTLVNVGEAGEPEAIVPLHRANQYGFTNMGGVTINMRIESSDPDYISRLLARRLQQTMGAGI